MPELQKNSPAATARVEDRDEQEVTLTESERSPLLIQMWTDLFKHLSTLGVAGAAGLLILLELEVLDGGGAFWTSVAALVIGSLLALQGSWATIALVEKGGGNTQSLRRHMAASALFMGAGAGLLVATILL